MDELRYLKRANYLSKVKYRKEFEELNEEQKKEIARNFYNPNYLVDQKIKELRNGTTLILGL